MPPATGERWKKVVLSEGKAFDRHSAHSRTGAVGGCSGRRFDAGSVPWRRRQSIAGSIAGQGDEGAPARAAVAVAAKEHAETFADPCAHFQGRGGARSLEEDTTGHFQIVKTYPICGWSGDLGPKLHEGDRQAPEGFYTITSQLMNPNSNYYLSINTGFPNSFDKANGCDGAFLMVHGDCWLSGCYAMTDEQMGEIYSLARDALLGQPSFQIQAYPFRLTPANLARHRTSPHMAFWKMLKVGNDHFETTHLEPNVYVCDRRYVFNPQHTPNSSNPLVFDPAGKCPAFVVNPKIARPALEKQRADEVEYAQLVKDDVPVAPVYSGLDGGMNKVFLARYPDRIIPLARVLPPTGSQLPEMPAIPGLTTIVRWRADFLAPRPNRSPPLRCKSPRPVRQRMKAARIQRQPDRRPRRRQIPRRRARSASLQSRRPAAPRRSQRGTSRNRLPRRNQVLCRSPEPTRPRRQRATRQSTRCRPCPSRSSVAGPSIVGHHHLVNADRSDLDYCISPYVMKVAAARGGVRTPGRPR